MRIASSTRRFGGAEQGRIALGGGKVRGGWRGAGRGAKAGDGAGAWAGMGWRDVSTIGDGFGWSTRTYARSA